MSSSSVDSLPSQVSYQPKVIQSSAKGSSSDANFYRVYSAANSVKSLSQSFRSIKEAIKDDAAQTELENLNRIQKTGTLLSNMEGDVEAEMLSITRRKTRTSVISVSNEKAGTSDMAPTASRKTGESSIDGATREAGKEVEEEVGVLRGQEEQEEEDVIPDGGFAAWITAASTMLLVISSWGANSSYGVFLQYYLNNGVFKGATEYDYALIGCIVVCMAQGLAPFALLLVPVIGFKETLIFGCVVNFLGYLLASFARTIWELYLTQGVLVGISFSFLFVPGTVVIPQWFLHKRALANGLAVSGAGSGGILFSLSVNKIIEISGDQKWALRYLAFATTFLAVVATCLIRNRTFKKQPLTKAYFVSQFKILFDMSIFKEFSPLAISIWFLFMFLGYSILLFTLADYATSVGLNSKQGSILTAIFNVGQVFGRPSLGFVADKLGRINFTIYCTVFNFLLYFAFWMNATTYGALIAFALISGFTMGVGSLMMQPLSADNISHPTKFPASYCLINIVVGLGALLSEPISVLLKRKNAPKPYLHSQVYGGVCVAAAIFVIMAMREWKIRKVLKYRLQATLERLDHGEFDDDKYYDNDKEQFREALNERSNGQQVPAKDGASTVQGKNVQETATQCVSHDLLMKRKRNYERLLKHSLKAAIFRIFYPVKV